MFTLRYRLSVLCFFVGFGFLGFSSELFSATSDVVFYKPFVKTPIVYRGSHIGFSDSKIFSISKSKGAIDWVSQDDYLHGTELSVLFNLVFFVNKDTHLVAVDYRLGQKVWESVDTVARFVVSYPYIAFVSSANTVGVLEFMTGKLVWQKPFVRSVDAISFIGQSGILGVVSTKGLNLFYVKNGDNFQTVVLPQKMTKIVSAWNKGLVFQADQDFYVFTLDSNSVVKSSVVPTSNATWVDEHYYLTFDSRKNLLKTTEIESNQVVWTESGVPTGSMVTFAMPYIFTKTTADAMCVYRVNRSTIRKFEDKTVAKGLDFMRQSYVDGMDVYFVTPTQSQMVNLENLSTKKWTRFPWRTL